MPNPRPYLLRRRGLGLAQPRSQERMTPREDYLQPEAEGPVPEGRLGDMMDMEGGFEETAINLPRAPAKPAGQRITLRDLDGEEIEYELVDPRFHDPANGLVSIDSPLGQALLGRDIGEEVLVPTPGGELRYTILRIEPNE